MAQENVTAYSAFLARVTNVNLREYTVDLLAESGNTRWTDVPFASPYCHNEEGEGLTVVPEVGSLAICITRGDAKDAVVVMGFIMSPGDDRFRGQRRLARPGDITASTRDGNFLHLFRGGVVQIGATPIAQRMYIPLDNLIRDVCQNYLMQTLAGELEWKVESEDLSDPQTMFQLRARELADDAPPSKGEDSHSITVTIGRAFDANGLRQGSKGTGSGLGATPVGYIEVEVRPQQGTRKLIFRVDKDGNQYSRTEGSSEEEVAGDKFHRVEGDFTRQVQGGYSLAVGPNASIPVAGVGMLRENVQGNTTRTAGAFMTDECKFRVIDATHIFLGSGNATEPVPLGIKLMAWLATHQHVPNGPVPIQAPALGSVLSTKVSVE